MGALKLEREIQQILGGGLQIGDNSLSFWDGQADVNLRVAEDRFGFVLQLCYASFPPLHLWA